MVLPKSLPVGSATIGPPPTPGRTTMTLSLQQTQRFAQLAESLT
jgi:hypothetical protein